MKECGCGRMVEDRTWNEFCKKFFCSASDCNPAGSGKAPGMVVRGNNRTNKKMSDTMSKYIKSRYVGPDGHVKCDKRYKPSEHYLGS